MNEFVVLKPSSAATPFDLGLLADYPQPCREVDHGETLNTSENSLIFVDGSLVSLESSLVGLGTSEGVFVLVAKEENENNLKLLEQHPLFNHILSTDADSFEQEIQNLVHFYSTQDASHLIQVQWKDPKMTLTNSDDRYSAYDQVTNYIEDNLQCFSEFPDIITTACSELLSNAFHDAPKDKVTGEALYPERDKKVSLSPPDQITFQFGVSEDEHLWIKVEDTFGTFEKARLIQALSRAAKERKALVRTKGGAGLGLLMMFNWSTAMYFVLSKSGHTTIFCKFRVTKRRKKFDNHLSHLHIL